MMNMFKDKSAISKIEGLTKGSITINKTEEYKKLLTEYPNNPYVNRLFADFLKEEKSFANAIKIYQKAYELFMVEGETLHAIATLFELWEIVKPVPYDFRSLHSHLRRKKSHNSIVFEFFAKMSYKELRSTLSYLKKIGGKANEIVKEQGDPEEALFFVISGELVKSQTDPESDRHPVVQFLKANDLFGDDLPCAVKSPMPYQVEAASNAELLKITKEDFLNLCEEHPELKHSFTKLIKYPLIPDAKKSDKFSRNTPRRHLTISLDLDILDSEVGQHPISVKGSTRDISLGGVCIIIDPKYLDIPLEDIIDRKTKLRFGLPNESLAVSITGRIAWCKKTKINEHQTYALGVEFNKISPQLSGLMIIFVNTLSSMNKQHTCH